VAGDGVVPAVSAKGIIVDPNGKQPDKAIPAFMKGTIERYIERLSIPGFHGGYLDEPEVQDAIFERLISDFE
jgi:hypothetical protein